MSTKAGEEKNDGRPRPFHATARDLLGDSFAYTITPGGEYIEHGRGLTAAEAKSRMREAMESEFTKRGRQESLALDGGANP